MGKLKDPKATLLGHTFFSNLSTMGSNMCDWSAKLAKHPPLVFPMFVPFRPGHPRPDREGGRDPAAPLPPPSPRAEPPEPGAWRLGNPRPRGTARPPKPPRWNSTGHRSPNEPKPHRWARPTQPMRTKQPQEEPPWPWQGPKLPMRPKQPKEGLPWPWRGPPQPPQPMQPGSPPRGPHPESACRSFDATGPC